MAPGLLVGKTSRGKARPGRSSWKRYGTGTELQAKSGGGMGGCIEDPSWMGQSIEDPQTSSPHGKELKTQNIYGVAELWALFARCCRRYLCPRRIKMPPPAPSPSPALHPHELFPTLLSQPQLPEFPRQMFGGSVRSLCRHLPLRGWVLGFFFLFFFFSKHIFNLSACS